MLVRFFSRNENLYFTALNYYYKENFTYIEIGDGDEREKKTVPLFNNIKVHEGLILRYTVTSDKILLIHGHQGKCPRGTR
jgi:hypothetical protein